MEPTPMDVHLRMLSFLRKPVGARPTMCQGSSTFKSENLSATFWKHVHTWSKGNTEASCSWNRCSANCKHFVPEMTYESVFYINKTFMLDMVKMGNIQCSLNKDGEEAWDIKYLLICQIKWKIHYLKENQHYMTRGKSWK